MTTCITTLSVCVSMLPDPIRQRLIDKYDPEDIIDLLNLDTEQLVNLLDWYILENIEKLEIDE